MTIRHLLVAGAALAALSVAACQKNNAPASDTTAAESAMPASDAMASTPASSAPADATAASSAADASSAAAKK
jgi:hypothetical protein